MGLPLTREMLEALEVERLSHRAALSSRSRGREHASRKGPDPFRTEYMRDRDRIIHCKSFRRLSHKTQVFLAPEGDHYRTRLTHTLEVSQIARSVARSLALNEDLTEAIALGHDLGHTPFGHTGETAITECYTDIRGEFPDAPQAFEHHEQSVRVVERLEYGGKGLNLTWEVRDGIRGHTRDAAEPATLEGSIVRRADKIAYVSHDVDDAVRAGVISDEDLPEEARRVLGATHVERIGTMVQDLTVMSADLDGIRMSDEVLSAMKCLERYLWDAVYTSPDAKAEEPKAREVVKHLFMHYLEHPEQMPAEYVAHPEEPLWQRVTDYVAGMTDRYALTTYKELFLPKAWMI